MVIMVEPLFELETKNKMIRDLACHQKQVIKLKKLYLSVTGVPPRPARLFNFEPDIFLVIF